MKVKSLIYIEGEFTEGLKYDVVSYENSQYTVKNDEGVLTELEADECILIPDVNMEFQNNLATLLYFMTKEAARSSMTDFLENSSVTREQYVELLMYLNDHYELDNYVFGSMLMAYV